MLRGDKQIRIGLLGFFVVERNLCACVHKGTDLLPADERQTDNGNRGFAVEEWEGDFLHAVIFSDANVYLASELYFRIVVPYIANQSTI